VPVKKMRVEVLDESGNRYKVSVEGNVTRKSALRILDMVELLGGIPALEHGIQKPEESSRADRVRLLVEKHFPLVKFSASEAQSVYNNETGEQIDLSTISTYLSRLADKGLLIKERSSRRVSYRLMPEGIKNFIESR
jgi:DNA-binding transcriptional ArsR family regulator